MIRVSHRLLGVDWFWLSTRRILPWVWFFSSTLFKVYICLFVSSLHPGNLRSTEVGVLRAWSVMFSLWRSGWFFGCQLSPLQSQSCNCCVPASWSFRAKIEEFAAFLLRFDIFLFSFLHEPSLSPRSCFSIYLHSGWWDLRQLCFIFSLSLSFYLESSPKLHAFSLLWSRRVTGVLQG